MSEAEIRANFEEALERLKTVHTRDELEEARKNVYKWRDKLLETSEDFKREVEGRRMASQAEHKGRFSEFDGRVKDIKLKAGRFKIDPWMTDQHLKGLNEMMLERMRPKAQGLKLVCPECGEPDRRNVKVTGKGKRKKKAPWCFKCNVQLIPEHMLNKWKKNLNIKLRKKFSDEERRMGYGN